MSLGQILAGSDENARHLRDALAAMTQPELLELVLGLAEARSEVLREIMARVHKESIRAYGRTPGAAIVMK